MTILNDVFDTRLLNEMIDNGYVRRQTHPTEPLAILNYSEKAVFDKQWNDVTRRCRGLIYNVDTHEVVARPFEKFFNHNESTAPIIGLYSPVTVTDKQDGSLGILYRKPSGGWAIATRGSFTSDQALHATHLFNRRYSHFRPNYGLTHLFEIIYPENRIVVDYGDLDDLVLLGAVEIANGRSYSVDTMLQAPHQWPGPYAEVFTYRTYSEALAATPRPGMEGMVVHDLSTDQRVKIKQADYVALHRIVTGLTSRRVHEAMLAGIDLDEFISPLPDEFHDWVRDVAGAIEDKVKLWNRQIDLQWQMTVAECEERSPEAAPAVDPVTAFEQASAGVAVEHGWPASVSMGLSTGLALTREQRKLFASVARNSQWAWALFARLDGKDYQRKLLELAEPEIELPGRTFSEANA